MKRAVVFLTDIEGVVWVSLFVPREIEGRPRPDGHYILGEDVYGNRGSPINDLLNDPECPTTDWVFGTFSA